jgi:transposase
MFEAFAIRVLRAAGSVEQARLLLGLSWGCAPRIMDRAVERGLLERNLEEVTHVGLDEKSFRRGQDDISVMTDIDASRVLEVSEGRDEAAADVLWDTLSQDQKEHVEAVARICGRRTRTVQRSRFPKQRSCMTSFILQSTSTRLSTKFAVRSTSY